MMLAGAIRRIMRIQLGTKPVTRQDMEELRCILLDLQVQLNSIIDRIPEPKAYDLPSNSNRSWSVSSRSPAEVRTSDTELPGDGPTGCSEQYHTPVLVAFHKWAKILLSLFIDKVSIRSICIPKYPNIIIGFLCRISTFPQKCQESHLARCPTKVCQREVDYQWHLFNLTQPVLSAIATVSWRSSSPSPQIPISSPSNGAGQATTSQCTQP